MYDLLSVLEKEYQAEITELQHAYRINGIVDIWKRGKKVYDIKNNCYLEFDLKDKLPWVIEKIKTEEKRDPFKKTEKGRVSYQEFKNLRKKEKFEVKKSPAAEYHWNQNFLNKSEDHLYFLICGDRVKIGRSCNVERRMKELETGLSGKYICCVIKNKGFLETIMHRCFKEKRLVREWFAYDEIIRNFILLINTKDNAYKISS